MAIQVLYSLNLRLKNVKDLILKGLTFQFQKNDRIGSDLFVNNRVFLTNGSYKSVNSSNG